MKGAFQKSWLTPLIAFVFGIMAFTGILMLLHLKSGSIAHIHQWFGLIFIIGVALHLTLNWRIFRSYFGRQKSSISVIAVVALASLLLLALLAAGSDTRGFHRYGGDHAGGGYSRRR